MFVLDRLQISDATAYSAVRRLFLANSDSLSGYEVEHLLRRTDATGACYVVRNPSGAICASASRIARHEPTLSQANELIGVCSDKTERNLLSFLIRLHLVMLAAEDDQMNLDSLFAVVLPDSPLEHLLSTEIGLAPRLASETFIHARDRWRNPLDPLQTVLGLSDQSLPDARATLLSRHVGGSSFTIDDDDDHLLKIRFTGFVPAIITEPDT